MEKLLKRGDVRQQTRMKIVEGCVQTQVAEPLCEVEEELGLL